jgi:hypothetical protein
MRHARAAVAATLAIALLALTPTQQASAHREAHRTADPGVISDWNQIGVATIGADAAAGRKQAIEVYLYLAFMHAAMYNAVVGIEGGYEPYRFHRHAPRHASSQAAAVAAAHRILVTYSPEQQATLDAAYAASLEAIPDGRSESRGVAYGELAAATMVAQRADDGRYGPTLFEQVAAPGIWRPTPPAGLPFSAPWLGYVTPLLLRSGDQFDPGPAPSLTSQRYTRDFEEVKAMGRIDSTVRTSEQTETARFYAGNPGLQFTLGLVDQAQKRGLDIVGSARMFAAVHLALADASIAIWWTKHHYGVWRPITAIQLAADDSNPETLADSTWNSVIPSPPYPDYVSGYNGVMGAYTRALQEVLGTEHLDLALTSTVFPAPDPRHIRVYDTGREARQELIDARVWLGLHFRFADTSAARMGQQVAHYGLTHYLQPVDEDDD